MSNLSQILQQLQEERSRIQQQLKKLESAIAVLQAVGGAAISNAHSLRSRPGRAVSAAARRRMAAAQRARWGRVRQQAPANSKGSSALSTTSNHAVVARSSSIHRRSGASDACAAIAWRSA